MVKLFLLGTTLSLISVSPAFCMDEDPKDTKKHTRKKAFFRRKSISDIGNPQVSKRHRKSVSLDSSPIDPGAPDGDKLRQSKKKARSSLQEESAQTDLETPMKPKELQPIREKVKQRSKSHHRTPSGSVQKDSETPKKPKKPELDRDKLKQKSKNPKEKRPSLLEESEKKAKDQQEMIDNLKTADELDKEAYQLFIQYRTQETLLREKELAKGSLQEQQEVNGSKTADELDKEAHQLLSQNRVRAKLLKEKASAKRSPQEQEAVDNSKTADELYEEAQFCTSINQGPRGFKLMQEASKKGSKEAKVTLEALGL